MCPDPRLPRRAGGSALLIALFVIVVMALLAAAMGRFLVDSSEKNTVEVRSTRALLAAQSGLEVALYRLFPSRTLAQPAPPAVCDASRTITFSAQPGLIDCQATIRCQARAVTHLGRVSNSYHLISTGRCGQESLASANPDFVVSRTVIVEASDGVEP